MKMWFSYSKIFSNKYEQKKIQTPTVSLVSSRASCSVSGSLCSFNPAESAEPAL